MGDAVSPHQPRKTVAAAFLPAQHKSGTCCQSPQISQKARIEAERSELQDAGFGCHGEAIDLGRHKIGDAAMRDGDALWCSGGA